MRSSLRTTGDSGFRGISGRAGSPEWWAGVLLAVAIIAGLLVPVTALLGLPPLPWLSRTPIQIAGVVLTVLGMAATTGAQVAMGSSWRIGVDETEHTALVTSGPFAAVRNPVFTAVAITGIGLALMVPNLVAVLAVALLLLAVHLQVRIVEEPYLRRTHGVDYEVYAARTGRFLPGVGRLATSRATTR